MTWPVDLTPLNPRGALSVPISSREAPRTQGNPMADHCMNEGQISLLGQRWADLDKKMDRMVSALESLAEQRIEIKHLDEDQKDSRAWLKHLEQRTQALEKAPGSAASKFLWVMVGAAMTVFAGVSTGMIMFWFKGGP